MEMTPYEDGRDQPVGVTLIAPQGQNMDMAGEQLRDEQQMPAGKPLLKLTDSSSEQGDEQDGLEPEAEQLPVTSASAKRTDGPILGNGGKDISFTKACPADGPALWYDDDHE